MMTPDIASDDSAIRLHCLKLALRHLNPPSAEDAVREAETLRRYWLGLFAADDPKTCGKEGEMVINNLAFGGLSHGATQNNVELERDSFLAVPSNGFLGHASSLIGASTPPMMAKADEAGNASPPGRRP